MKELFTKRMGIQIPEAEITFRNDAPDALRSYLLNVMKQFWGLKQIRELVCSVTKEAPDSNNWAENEYMYTEVLNLIKDCLWYRVYDIIELFYQQLVIGQRAKFESKINEFFLEKGVGWKLSNGKIEIRGDEPFEIAISEIDNVFNETKLSTPKAEIKLAILDLSRRPDPDLTGAVQHSSAALECLCREVTGDQKTLGALMNKYPDIVPSPLDKAISKIYGFASEHGRHLTEGGEPAYEEAELVVHLSASLCSYLCKRHILIEKINNPWG